MTARLAFISLIVVFVAPVMQVRGDDAVEVAADFDFAWEISPMLAKAGCAAADCHGGASGRGGFKLSLFSSNPHDDYLALTRELGGRRIDLVQPANSLLLRKPTKQKMKHGGGRLLHAKGDDPTYTALLNWIERGAQWSSGNPQAPTGLSLEIENDQARVIALTAPTKGCDVTAMTRFQSTNEAVAEIDEDGKLTRIGSGETWIIATYGQLRERTAVLIPFAENGKTQTSDHPMDRVWLQRLDQLGLQPAARAPRHLLARRLYSDLTGRPPRPDEMAEFLELSEKDQMRVTAARLMDGPEFAATFGLHLATWFEIPISERDPKNAAPVNTRLREFFQQAMLRGDSLETVARSVLLDPEGQAAWKRLSDPRDRAEYLGRTLLGRRIDCARCHNHPLDRWKQEEHLKFSAFFSDDRPDPKMPQQMMAGRFFEPETGREIVPALLPLGSQPPTSWATKKPARQEQIAWFILDGAGDDRARNFANRIFENLIGRALVNTPDDQRLSNPAIHEPLLSLLADHLKKHGSDPRALIELIVSSQLYAASSEVANTRLAGSPALTYMARREARRLSSDEFRRAVSEVLGVPAATPLPAESPLAQQLYLINSGLIQTALATPGNQVEAIHDFVATPAQRLQNIYALVLSRPPTDQEREALLPGLESAKDTRQSLFDLAFALLASREFGSIR